MTGGPPAAPARDRGAWLLAGVALVSLGSLIPFVPREALAALFFDDAFYYFTVARNLAAGQGLTFDGIHATNGFHPLWLVVIAPLFAALPGDLIPLRAVAILETALITAALVLYYRELRRWVDRDAALLAAMVPLALPGARGILRGGLETGLLFLLLILVWRAQGRAGVESTRRSLALGGLLALAFLARLEATVLVPAVLLRQLSPAISGSRASSSAPAWSPCWRGPPGRRSGSGARTASMPLTA